jgi:hypothetical protein
MAWKFGELFGPVRGGGKRLLQLVVGETVTPTYPETAVFNVHIFGGVLGWFSDNVRSRGRGRFGFGVEATSEHLVGPSG